MDIKAAMKDMLEAGSLQKLKVEKFQKIPQTTKDVTQKQTLQKPKDVVMPPPRRRREKLDDDESAESDDSISTMNTLISKTSKLTSTVTIGGEAKRSYVAPSTKEDSDTEIVEDDDQQNGGKNFNKVMNDPNADESVKAYAKFAKAAQMWVKAEKKIQELNDQKAEIMKKIKEFEDQKDEADGPMREYLDMKGKDEYPINDGTKLSLTTKKTTETFSVKTIPKYTQDLFAAINEENIEFIKTEIMTISDEKSFPDIKWQSLPTDPKKYLDKLIDESYFLSVMSALYASKCRKVEESVVIKRKANTTSTTRGRGRGRGKA